MRRIFGFLIFSAALVALAGGGYAWYCVLRAQQFVKEEVPAAVDFKAASQNSLPNISAKILPATLPSALPSSLNLQMDFYAQAPNGNWDYPWQEACEEASVLLTANTYLQHHWSRAEFTDEILRLVDWENRRFGDYRHTTVAQTAQIFSDYLGLRTVIHANPGYDEVRRILARGHFIVMPFAGKELHNPNYRNGGPVYHMMVVKGYKEGRSAGAGGDASAGAGSGASAGAGSGSGGSGGKIITNDVGTRNGADYVYTWQTIQNALHDYVDPIDNGAKSIIEVIPPS